MKKLLSLVLLTCLGMYAYNLKSKSLQEILDTLQEQKVSFVDFRWSDINGALKEITLPTNKVASALKNDIFFDGSSIQGFSQIAESDLRLKADFETFQINPINIKNIITGQITCSVFNTDGQPYQSCPRNCLKKVLEKAKTMGFECLCGAELEFFLFKKEDSSYLTADQNGYCNAETNLKIIEFKNILMQNLLHLNVHPEKIHHEVAPGQFEVVLECTDPLTLADRIIITKHTIITLANLYGLTATFMPKPIAEFNGSGMHIHTSMKKNGINAFYQEGADYHLSTVAHQFIAGLLDKAQEINLLFNATVNSFKRLVAGYEAPIFLCCGDKNRSAAIRIPEITRESLQENNGAAVRIELRWPDASCNPYLALAGLFSAGIDGIETKKSNVQFINQNLYHFAQSDLDELAIKTIPNSLYDSIILFEQSDFAKDLLGEPLYQNYVTTKQDEWYSYYQTINDIKTTEITAWELEQGI